MDRMPAVYTSLWPSATEYSGMRRCHSRRATRSSWRARWEPRQRWTPPPKARWRLTSRSKRTTSASANSASSVLAEPSMIITLSPCVDGAAAELGVLHRHPGHAHDRGLPAQQLLDGRRDERRVVDELPALVGMLAPGRRTCSRAWRSPCPARRSGTGSRCRGCPRGSAGRPSTSASRNRLSRSSRRSRSRSIEDHVEVVVDRVGDLLLVASAVLLPNRVPVTTSGRMMPSFMVRNGGQLLERQPEQGQEHLRRERDGELRGEVDLAPVDEPVDEVVDQLA